MAIIPMISTFTVCPEGEHVFRIYKVDYDAEFGKLSIHLVNAQGVTHTERFSLMSADGSMNERACAAFSFFAKTALNDFAIEEIEHTALVDHYIKATVNHTKAPSTKDPNKTVTFVNLGDKSPATGFEGTPCEKALTLGKETVVENKTNSAVDLSSLLN